MATYQVIVKNQSGVNQQYLLFNQPPKAKSGIPDGYSNVWVRTSGTPSPNGKQNLTITSDVFAMCGTLPQPLGNGVVVTETDETPVTLAGQQAGTAPKMILVDGGPSFQAPFGTTTAAGAFGINTGDWENNRYKNKIWYGMGKYDENNNIVSVASFPAEPNQQYTLQPVVTFFIGTGSYKPGTAVNVTQIGQIATIDFTQALECQTVATIIHKSNLVYTTPVFSYPQHRNGEDRIVEVEVEAPKQLGAA